MDKEEKIELIDKVLKGLKSKSSETIPQILDGKYPKGNSTENQKYLILEKEILDLGLVSMFSHTSDVYRAGFGGTKGTHGFYYLQLTTKGIELLLSGKSVRTLYDIAQKKEQQDIRIKELDLLLKEFQHKNLEKDQIIKNLTIENGRLQKFNILIVLGTAAITGLISIILSWLS